MGLELIAVSPAALGLGDNNDYAGIGTSSFARLSADAGGSTLTGIVAGADGRMIVIVNVSANTLTIAHENAGSAAANRFLSTTGANLTLTQDDIAIAVYDAATARWRVWEVP